MFSRSMNLSRLPFVHFNVFLLIIKMCCTMFTPLTGGNKQSKFRSQYLHLSQSIYFSFVFLNNPFHVKVYSFHGETTINVKYVQVCHDKVFKTV